MAYPWSANDILTAADLNAAISTGIVSTGLGAWTSYTPTVTQSGAVTKTVTVGSYIKIGRLVIFSLDLAITGTGTASNNVIVSLPVTAAAANQIVGSGIIFDSSASTVYAGVAHLNSTSSFGLWSASTDGSPSQFLGLRVFTAALASGDAIRVSGMYQSAT
jgi:hypothetical protein